jgi:TnpA family transposase
VPGTLRDSLLILGLLLEQETDLEPIEIMTDTAAYADMVFRLFWLLGYQFSPRLADIGDARFWRIDRNVDYGVLNGLARHRINIEIIRRNWDDLLRLAGSLKLGRIHAGAIMRVLQVKDRPTTLAKALAELGRIVKTLHMLGYIDSEETRRRILTQLNRQELRHRLARRVCHGNRGEIRKVYRQEQEEQLGALGLTLNAIALWNSTYIQAALDHLAREGWDISRRDTARSLMTVHRPVQTHGPISRHLRSLQSRHHGMAQPPLETRRKNAALTVHSRALAPSAPLSSASRPHRPSSASRRATASPSASSGR